MRLQAAFDHLPTASGEGINGTSLTTPSVGRSRVLEVWAPQHAAADPGRTRNSYPVPDLPKAQPYRFEAAVFPDLTNPKTASTQGVSLASVAARPLFSIIENPTEPSAMRLEAATAAATTVDSVDVHPDPQPSPAHLNLSLIHI